MLRYIFVVMFFIFAVSISEGLEVGDSALGTTFASGDKQVKFADFHGKSNLIVVGDAANHPEFISQLEQKAEAFETTYGATMLPVQGEDETLIIDKSGYVRWKFPDAANSVPTVEKLESELAKLKRDDLLPIGSPTPDFRLMDAESGIPFNLSNYKGKKHILATLLLQTY